MLPIQEDSGMGKASRQSPAFLAQKLLKIRKAIGGGLSQEEMLGRLGMPEVLNRTYISKYEQGVIEPPLKVLLRYAELASVHLEVLADDELMLPDKLPCAPKSAGIKKTGTRKRQQ
jgi:transcriptional regulator with XRE-family HTH domain